MAAAKLQLYCIHGATDNIYLITGDEWTILASPLLESPRGNRFRKSYETNNGRREIFGIASLRKHNDPNSCLTF